MPDPMTDERVTEIVRAATHGKAIVLGGLVRDAAHIDAEKKEEIRKAIGTVWIRGVRELAAEVRRLRAELDVAVTAADPFKIERVRSIVVASTRLVRIERDAERAERDRLTAFVAQLRDLAFMGGQNGEIVRRWILQAFAEFDAARPGEAESSAEENDTETRVFNALADAGVEGLDLNAMTVPELTAFVMRAVRGEQEVPSS